MRVGLVRGYDQIRLAGNEVVEAYPGEQPYFSQNVDTWLCLVTLIAPVALRLNAKPGGKSTHVKAGTLPHGLQPMSERGTES